MTAATNKQQQTGDEQMGLFAIIKRDFAVNSSNTKARSLLLCFRIVHVFASAKETHRLLWILGLPLQVVYRLIFDWIMGIELPARTKIGPGLRIMHGHALVVNYMATIGANCTLRQCTTIGCKILPEGLMGPSPVIGNGVDIGSNVVVLGGISLGDRCIVGAGSVVVHDVPAHAIVAGNPARVIRQLGASAVLAAVLLFACTKGVGTTVF